LRALVPGVDLAPIKRNLARLVPSEKLEQNLHVGVRGPAVEEAEAPVPPTLLDDEAFAAADLATPKYAHWWAFPACAFSGTFSGNERGVFEAVRDDPSIRKIVLTRGVPVHAEGENVLVVPLESPEGQYHLLRAGNVFVKHSPTRNLVYPLEPRLHNIVNLWHGIPLKRIGLASRDMEARQQAIAREHAKCRAVIASSRVDRLAMASAFHPLTFHDVWVTGLPRNDFILRPLDRLPADMRAERERLRAMLAGRKLVLFMPTFRNGQALSYYRFDAEETGWLRAWLERNDAVLGIREHMADSARAFSASLEGLAPIDLGQQAFPDAEILYREGAVLVTDYSSCFFDFMLTGKPAVSFAYDLDRYAEVERGLFYDLDQVFPGPVCRDFGSLRKALESVFDPPSPDAAAALEWRRAMFFDHVDDGSSARVAERVRALMDDDAVGKEFT
jgi:CDP-glycerol glycerophosphotransferase (TagB/SpsB family)